MFVIVEALANPPPLLLLFSFPLPLSTFPAFPPSLVFVPLLPAGAEKVGLEGLGFGFDFATFEEDEVEEGRGGLNGFGGILVG